MYFLNIFISDFAQHALVYKKPGEADIVYQHLMNSVASGGSVKVSDDYGHQVFISDACSIISIYITNKSLDDKCTAEVSVFGMHHP